MNKDVKTAGGNSIRCVNCDTFDESCVTIIAAAYTKKQDFSITQPETWVDVLDHEKAPERWTEMTKYRTGPFTISNETLFTVYIRNCEDVIEAYLTVPLGTASFESNDGKEN